MNHFQKILVVQHWGIGDVVLITPLLKEIRHLLPNVNITVLVGSKACSEVINNSTLCEEVLIKPKSKIRSILFFFSLRRKKYDLAIIGTHISIRMAQMLRIVSNIKNIAGDYSPPQRYHEYIPPTKWGYTYKTRWLPLLQRPKANLKILKTVLPNANKINSVFFHIDSETKSICEKLWLKKGLNGKNVLGIHYGASEARKKEMPYLIQKINDLLPYFFEKYSKSKVLIFIGPAEEKFAQDIINNANIILINNRSLREIACLISKTKLFLGNDSGLGHIAACFNIPTITFTGPESPGSIDRPWSQKSHQIRNEDYLFCRPCNHHSKKYYKCNNMNCLIGISNEKILEKISLYFS